MLMITDFQQFGVLHILSLLLPCLVGACLTGLALKLKDAAVQRKIGLALAVLIIIIRGSRYVMDVFHGAFDWFDLFSLHICHIDLIFLVICLIKPVQWLFNFCFLLGIPCGLMVALFPGPNHPAPGEPRAILFIMSHVMLVVGALFLAAVYGMRLRLKILFILAAAGNIGLVALYFINSLLHTNFLYIMKAPAGTVIQTLESLFGWPGYVLVIDVLVVSFMLLMYWLGTALFTRKPVGTLVRTGQS